MVLFFMVKNSIHLKRLDVFSFGSFNATLVKFQICSFIVEKLKDKETHIFIENSFRDGVLKTTGTDVDAIMPAVSRFGSGSAGNRSETKKRVIDRLLAYFEKYLDLVGVK